MRDIGRRFVVLYNGWPVSSADDERSALKLMVEMRETQRKAFEERMPLRVFDNRTLWKVMDMGAAKVAS